MAAIFFRYQSFTLVSTCAFTDALSPGPLYSGNFKVSTSAMRRSSAAKNSASPTAAMALPTRRSRCASSSDGYALRIFVSAAVGSLHRCFTFAYSLRACVPLFSFAYARPSVACAWSCTSGAARSMMLIDAVSAPLAFSHSSFSA